MNQNQMKMPKIAMGAWAWGNDGTFGNTLAEEELRPVFQAAVDQGLNLWDTAYVYGMGTSETVLGNFLKSIPRESYCRKESDDKAQNQSRLKCRTGLCDYSKR